MAVTTLVTADAIAARVRQRIRLGLDLPGALIASIRDLAEELGCSSKTVQTAYKTVEAERLIKGSPRGYIVAPDADRYRLERVITILRNAHQLASAEGFEPADIARATALLRKESA